MTTNTPPPRNDMSQPSIRTAAIVLLFKDGFSIDDLVEIFSLSSQNIQEHVRRAMFKTPQLPAPEQPVPGNQRKSKLTAVNSAKTTEVRTCVKCGGHNFYANRACKDCAKQYARNYHDRQKQGLSGRITEDPQEAKPGMKICTKCGAEKDIEEFDRNRPDCKQCRHDVKETGKAMQKRRAAKTKSISHLAVAAPAHDFVYSKPTRCPKCHAPGIRLRRRREANLEVDYWLHCRENGLAPCQLKIAHYKIPVDGKFQAATA